MMNEQQTKTKTVVAVVDENGNEAIYVDGQRAIVGNCVVFLSEIADCVGDERIRFRYMEVDGTYRDGCWPESLESLTRS